MWTGRSGGRQRPDVPRSAHGSAGAQMSWRELEETQTVHPYDPLRFHGTVVWLTEDQGGRRSPPVPAAHRDYAASGYVPPLTVDTGLASLVVGPAMPGAWRSVADAGWLVSDYRYPHDVVAGDVIVVTEGHTVAGYFHVDAAD